MSLIRFINFRKVADDRGSLIAIEGNRTVPFDIRRIYYLTDLKAEVPRGFHAHRSLQQVAVCITGKCRIVLDNGREREEAWLDSADKGLFINNMVWREMHDFSHDCVLVVLASEYYSETDYIRDYAEFCHLAKHAQDS